MDYIGEATWIMNHAIKHYNQGWDYVVECYEISDLASELEEYVEQAIAQGQDPDGDLADSFFQILGIKADHRHEMLTFFENGKNM